MKTTSCLFFFSIPIILAAQESFDIVNYTALNDWKKEQQSSLVSFTKVDSSDGSWCQLAVYKSVPSKGNIDADFSSEWNNLAAAPNKITTQPQKDLPTEKQGWKVQSGGANFTFEKKPALVFLTTFSGFGTCASVLVRTNKKAYLSEINQFLAGLSLTKPVSQMASTENILPIASKYKFSTTNFDDGWTSIPQENWVLATKDNIKVLIHYPNSITSKYRPDRKEEDKVVWDYFITPRYTNLSSFEQLPNNLSYEPVHFMAGNVIDRSGRHVFVALFRKGNTKNNWVEIICTDRNSFVQAFGIDKYDVMFDKWDALVKLSGYNKFAVAASDLTGKWTTNFSSALQYVNVYTGASAGTKTYQSEQVYEFTPLNTYKWQLSSAGGFVGDMNVQQVKSDGKFSLPTNWQLQLSDIEKKEKIYGIQFSCIKNGRILWINGNAFVKKD